MSPDQTKKMEETIEALASTLGRTQTPGDLHRAAFKQGAREGYQAGLQANKELLLECEAVIRGCLDHSMRPTGLTCQIADELLSKLRAMRKILELLK